MENLEMDDMKEITKEMAIKAAAAAMTNYFSDLYLKDKEFAMTFEELKLIALGMTAYHATLTKILFIVLETKKKVNSSCVQF